MLVDIFVFYYYYYGPYDTVFFLPLTESERLPFLLHRNISRTIFAFTKLDYMKVVHCSCSTFLIIWSTYLVLSLLLVTLRLSISWNYFL